MTPATAHTVWVGRDRFSARLYREGPVRALSTSPEEPIFYALGADPGGMTPTEFFEGILAVGTAVPVTIIVGTPVTPPVSR